MLKPLYVSGAFQFEKQGLGKSAIAPGHPNCGVSTICRLYHGVGIIQAIPTHLNIPNFITSTIKFYQPSILAICRGIASCNHVTTIDRLYYATCKIFSTTSVCALPLRIAIGIQLNDPSIPSAISIAVCLTSGNKTSIWSSTYGIQEIPIHATVCMLPYHVSCTIDLRHKPIIPPVASAIRESGYNVSSISCLHHLPSLVDTSTSQGLGPDLCSCCIQQ